MMKGCVRLLLAAAFACAMPIALAAQGGASSTLAGVAVDINGGVIPGATVVVKNTATGTTTETVTNSAGAFSVPALPAGLYTVTVTLAGFKTVVVNDVRLSAGTPSDIKVVLEVGNLEETIEVRGGSETVQTQSNTIASTINIDQLNSLPLPTRNAINFVTFLPGVNTTGVNRDSNFNGLPDSSVAISLDGVNNNENFNKSTEGLFAMVTPRQDAVEAVTVTSAMPGADSGGHGAVQIRFVTRSGTDRFTGSLYHYYRGPELNTNYYFNEIRNLEKNQVRLNQYGARQGGPIVIPGLYDGRGKAFFFVNYEELRLPNDFTRTRQVLSPDAQSGIFRYGNNTVNLYELAARNSQTATPDPLVAQVLSTIRTATGTTGVSELNPDPNTMAYTFLSEGHQIEKQPTVRIDYNLTTRHRLTGTYVWQLVDRKPDHLNGADVRFPGMPSFRHYQSYRPLTSGTLRSAFTQNVVNELRGGIKWGPSYFGRPSLNGPDTFANSGGYALVLGNIVGGGNANALTNLHTENAPSARSAWSWNMDDTVNWLRGNHSLSFGASYYDGHVWVTNQTMVEQLGFAVEDADPASAMFTTANFPGASAQQLTNARNLYALLTGRLGGNNAYVANARLDEATNQYAFLGPRTQRGRLQEWGVFAQDSWRLTSTLTLNAGVRWDVQYPFEASNDIMSTSFFPDLCGRSGINDATGDCNMFMPGTLTGIPPIYVQYDKGSPGYDTDWNNVAPNVGVAWRPNVGDGFLRTLLGDPEQATIRGGYSLAYNREGMAVFTGQYGANPGSTITTNRNVTLGNLGPLPALLRNGVPPAPAFPSSPSYPISPLITDSINIFHPAIEVGYARSFTVGFQRAISQDMAVEIRYVGTRGRSIWTEENYNEINITENGFLNEFRQAQANLQANIAAGRGNTFAYTGAPGTSPLPIFLAYLNGLGASRAGDTAAYSGTNWTNATLVQRLAQFNPQPYQMAEADLHENATRRNAAIGAGLAPNFFLVNPDVDESNVFKNGGYTDYDALQLDLRRRLSRGLQFGFNYQYAIAESSRFMGQRYKRVLELDTDVPRHAFKLTWDYNLPIGRGQRFGGGMNRLLDAFVGGWEFHGAGRVQNRLVDFGNVRLVGMSLQDLRDMYQVRHETDANGTRTVWMLPADVILNTRRAFNVSATSPTGYSDLGVPEGRYLAPANGPDCIEGVDQDLDAPGLCAPRNTIVFSPWFTRFDLTFAKRFNITGRVNFELRFDLINAFDNINFNDPPNLPGTAAQFGAAAFSQVTSAYQDNSNTFDPGGRLGQFVWRINW